MFESLFLSHSATQAVVIVSLICAVGLIFGKVKVLGVSLGVTFVFFAGIVAGHFGVTIDERMLLFAENFGLILFVYSLGVQVGPGFMSSFRSGGVQLNMLGIAVILIGTAMAVAMSYGFGVPLPEMMGVLSGATTNTPALGASQQTLSQLGLPTAAPALSCAVTYPLGVVGVILAIILMNKFFVRQSDIAAPNEEHVGNTFLATLRVQNPGVFGRDMHKVAELVHVPFVISRLWRDGKVILPSNDTVLLEGDRVLVVTARKDIDTIEAMIGLRESIDWNSDKVDWNALDSQLVSRQIIITRPEINGKRLGALRLRNSYGINITRIYRSGVSLLATPDLTLQMGDCVVVVGGERAVLKVEKVLGNAQKELNEPNLTSIYIGIVLGLILGAVPLTLPGISAPVKLGLAGGPIIVGILIGTYGPRLHLITYATRSANLMLRGFGLSLYLACLGLSSGGDFFETAISPAGLIWVGLGFLITVIPVLIVGLAAMRISKVDFGSTCGMLCGSMANPMALNYANDIISGEHASVAYATVYPLSMFLRVVIAQVVLMALM
ncbi:MAG: putative transporter [Alistipes sp.]|nr:putative transporter [Alistipes sp.]MBR2332369.1 putative transporter [Alistipes sp.]MBR6662887.1 putative transporter [Alistipes sp.]MBR7097400.1 putative transporter [Alistipes sp.]